VLDGLLREEVGVLLLGSGHEVGRGPQLGGQEAVGLAQGVVHGHGQVTSGAGVTGGGGIHVLDTSHVHQLLGDQGSHDTGTTRGGDQAHADGAALAGHLAGHGVGGTGVQAPVTTADGDQVHLGVDDATADSAGNLLGGLQAKTDVAVAIAHSDVALEASALAGSGLLLDGHDLHDLILQGSAEQEVHNLVLLDGQGEQEDLLDGSDLALLDKSAELGHGDPLLLLTLVASSAAAASTATATVTVTASVTNAKKSTI
jgi:hypothetical protein